MGSCGIIRGGRLPHAGCRVLAEAGYEPTGDGGRYVGTSGRPVEAGPQRIADQPRPPYRITALFLLGSIGLSQAIPWAKQGLAGNVPPLLAQLHPSVGPWLPLAAAALVAMLVVLPRSLSWPRWRFLLTGIALGWIAAIALAAEAHGLSALSAPFQRPLEYYASVPLVHAMGPRSFAAHYPDLGSRLSLHARTHGPASVLFPWMLSRLVGGSLLGVSLLVALVGVAGMVPTYAIAREFGDERAARLAALLFLCSPGVLIYSATSMDAVFMTVIGFAVAALVRFPRSSLWAVVAGVAWAISLSFTFGALVLGLLMAGFAVTEVLKADGEHMAVWRKQMARGGLVLVGLALGGLLLWVVGGMNLISDFRTASHANFNDPSRARPYLYWIFANFPAFLFVAGFVQTALLLHQTRLQWRSRTYGLESILWGTLVLSSLSGVFLGEVDHIWLFFIPLVAAVAGAGLDRTLRGVTASFPRPRDAPDEIHLVLGASLGQTLLVQTLLYTYW
jgi:hypothetical protein